MKTEQAEMEVLELLVKQCRVLRDPRNRRSRTELVPAAATWEMVFQRRLEELEAAGGQVVPSLARKEEVAA